MSRTYNKIQTQDQITDNEPPDHPSFLSEYGTVTYREWCGREIGRIRRAGSDAEIRENANGTICLVRKEVASV
jgi:hypothetical protein